MRMRPDVSMTIVRETGLAVPSLLNDRVPVSVADVTTISTVPEPKPNRSMAQASNGERNASKAWPSSVVAIVTVDVDRLTIVTRASTSGDARQPASTRPSAIAIAISVRGYPSEARPNIEIRIVDLVLIAGGA
jgi:hypothetical protein